MLDFVCAFTIHVTKIRVMGNLFVLTFIGDPGTVFERRKWFVIYAFAVIFNPYSPIGVAVVIVKGSIVVLPTP